VGIKNTGDVNKPVKGVALPILGLVGFFDINWSEKWSTAVGYSYMNIENSNGMNPNAFKTGQYGLINLLYKPVPKVMGGVELQYGSRDNYTDGFNSNAFKVQCTFKYNFAETFYRKSEAK